MQRTEDLGPALPTSHSAVHVSVSAVQNRAARIRESRLRPDSGPSFFFVVSRTFFTTPVASLCVSLHLLALVSKISFALPGSAPLRRLMARRSPTSTPTWHFFALRCCMAMPALALYFFRPLSVDCDFLFCPGSDTRATSCERVGQVGREVQRISH